jgi:RNA polymerase sigma-70 factor (ECF subfamily)
MRSAKSTGTARVDDLDEASLVERARRRDGAAFWSIMKRHSQRLYRVARGVLADDTEAEDVVQEVYMLAFEHLAEFRGEAPLSTWLTRIALNEALRRLRQRRPILDVKTIEAIHNTTDVSAIVASLRTPAPDPEAATALAEIRRLLERAVDALPEPFRVVFVMRDIEEMSIEETALQLGLRSETVKTRLHRARRLLREALGDKLAPIFTDTFLFAGERCDRLTQSVLNRVGVSVLAPHAAARAEAMR